MSQLSRPQFSTFFVVPENLFSFIISSTHSLYTKKKLRKQTNKKKSKQNDCTIIYWQSIRSFEMTGSVWLIILNCKTLLYFYFSKNIFNFFFAQWWLRWLIIYTSNGHIIFYFIIFFSVLKRIYKIFFIVRMYMYKMDCAYGC